MNSMLRSETPAECDLLQEGTTSRLVLHGDWTVQTIASVTSVFHALYPRLSSAVIFDLSRVTRLDTAGALLINEALDRLAQKGKAGTIQNDNERYTALLAAAAPPVPDPPAPALPLPLRLLDEFGRLTCDTIHLSGMLLGFLGQFVAKLGFLITHPSHIRWTSLVYFMEQAGLRAVPIVAMLSFLLGLVVAYMGMDELSKFGAKTLAIKLVEVSIFRELGVIITSIVVAGRSSSSFTAQIGSMVSHEEVAALRSMGMDPFALLVMPRIVALILTLPMLVFIADVAGILGGAVAICTNMEMSLSAYIIQVYNGAKLWNFLVGLIKAPFCALAIGIVGCFQGFKATGSAESVGFLTTIAVVQSIFLVIVIDAIFSIFFTVLGL